MNDAIAIVYMRLGAQMHNLASTYEELAALLSADGPTSERAPDDVEAPPEMAVHAPSTVPPNVDPSDEQSEHPAPVPAPQSGKRAKNEYTAKEWALGPHFLRYMQTEPFAQWDAEKQNAKRDAFIAAIPPDEMMSRWGDRFKKFCDLKP